MFGEGVPYSRVCAGCGEVVAFGSAVGGEFGGDNGRVGGVGCVDSGEAREEVFQNVDAGAEG